MSPAGPVTVVLAPAVAFGPADPAVLPALLAAAACLALTLPATAPARIRTLRTPTRPTRVPLLPVAAALAAVTLGPAAAVAVLGVTAAVRAVVRRAAAARLARDTRAAIPDLCRTVAAELRAGAPPPAALARAAADAPPALADHVRRVAALAHLGTDPPPDRWTAAPGTDDLAALAALWSVAGDTGAGLADGVDRLADALAAEERRRADTAAQLAGPRASAAVLAGLPVLGLALAAVLGAQPLRFLTSPAGMACGLGAVALDAAGVWWVRRLTAIPSHQ